MAIAIPMRIAGEEMSVLTAGVEVLVSLAVFREGEILHLQQEIHPHQQEIHRHRLLPEGMHQIPWMNLLRRKILS